MKEPADDNDPPARVPMLEQCWLAAVVFFLIVTIAMLVWLDSAQGAECHLEWNPQPDASRWRVYVGIDLLAEVTTPEAVVQLPDAACTVAVVAVNDFGTSVPATLATVFLRDQDSTDLMAWRTLRGYHREFIPGPRFYRTRIETP